MQIRKKTDGLAVTLSDDVVAQLGLKEGDTLEARVTASGAVELTRRANREKAIERLRAFRGLLPDGFVFDREEANAR